MRNISAKIIFNEKNIVSQKDPDSATNFYLRIYPPQKFIDSSYANLRVIGFKNGTSVLDLGKTISRTYYETLPQESSNPDVVGFIDISLSVKNSRTLFSSIGNEDYEFFLMIYPDGVPGIVYKLSIEQTDQLTIPVPEFIGTNKPSSVNLESELPSRSKYSFSYTDDAKRSVQSKSRNENNFSAYEKNMSLSYFLVNKSTVRIIVANIPSGYSRIEILSQKSNETSFNENSIKKINETYRSPMSNWFFAGMGEQGNKFKDNGGYVAFDLQISTDERNTITERSYDASDYFFGNARSVDGTITTQTLTGIRMMPVPNVNAGETARIRINLYGNCGKQTTFNIPSVVSTFGYATPRIVFDSKPRKISRSTLSKSTLMTSNVITDANKTVYVSDLSTASTSENDVFIDLGIQINTEETALNYLQPYFNQETIGARTSGAYLTAHVTRHDSFTGNTFDLGFVSGDKFIDRISDTSNQNSLCNIIGDTRDGRAIDPKAFEKFNKIVSSVGLSLVYNFTFYEITQEMIAAYLAIDSVSDQQAAGLLSNVSNMKTDTDQKLSAFLSNILIARTPIQMSSLSVEYTPKTRKIPAINTTITKNQQNTNIPYYEINGNVSESREHLAFAEIFRIEESKLYADLVSANSASPISRDFYSNEISLGAVPFVNGGFSARDFIPEDFVEGLSQNKERSLNIYYKIVPYGYIMNNGMLSNKIQKMAEFKVNLA